MAGVIYAKNDESRSLTPTRSQMQPEKKIPDPLSGAPEIGSGLLRLSQI